MKISDRDPERIQIMFFEANGMLATDATRKDVEKHFNRQELRRALLNQLGELAFPPRVNEAYVNGAARATSTSSGSAPRASGSRSTTRTRARRS